MTESQSDGEACRLTEEDKEYVATYLNETDDNKSHAIAEVRRWIVKSDDICARTDDFFILQFLRTSKFNVERAKRIMRNYLQQRSDTPEWHANRDPFLPEIQELLDLGTYLPLLKLDHLGRMVVFVRPTVRNPYKQKFSDALKVSIMITDIAEKYQIPGSLRGVSVIVDIDGVTFGHIIEIRPNMLKKMFHAWQDCYPIRVKSINFINVPTYVSVILRISKGFMNAKMKERFHIYTSDAKNTWAKEYPPDILPVEYGGTDTTFQELKEYWKRLLQDNHDWFIDDERYKVISTVK